MTFCLLEYIVVVVILLHFFFIANTMNQDVANLIVNNLKVFSLSNSKYINILIMIYIFLESLFSVFRLVLLLLLSISEYMLVVNSSLQSI